MTQPKIHVSEEAIAINSKLVELMFESINQSDGAISFEQFMQAALYTPGLGYYQNSLHKFGDKGDFVTAPEISDLFAKAIAESISGLINEATRSINILEIGAGKGQLALDLICELLAKNINVDYSVLEPSAQLQGQQKETLNSMISDKNVRIEWLSQLPVEFEGVIFANEVIDAMPVEIIKKNRDGWYYQKVGCGQDGFEWRDGNLVCSDDLPETINLQDSDFSVGYITELRPLIKPWLKSVSASLKSGVLLLADYGYPAHELYHPQRLQGTLKCFSRHQANNEPFERVGLQDITAHVNFSEVAKFAQANGLSVFGFTTQAGFLLANGVLDNLASQDVHTEQGSVEAYKTSRQLQLLMAPGQMGEVVKVMQLVKNSTNAANGFELQDHLHRL